MKCSECDVGAHAFCEAGDCQCETCYPKVRLPPGIEMIDGTIVIDDALFRVTRVIEETFDEIEGTPSSRRVIYRFKPLERGTFVSSG